MIVKKLFLILALSLILSGCTSYYKLKDPNSENTYYTTKINRLSSGAVKIKDAKSGAEVTLQNSEISQISQEEFHAATFEKK